jgi:UDP-3-O-[3-hydroxymyristoyl] glucosamine N-acyltransferase
MADPRFFRRVGPFTLGELARIGGAEPAPGADLSRSFSDVSPLSGDGAELIGFLDNRKYVPAFQASKLGACIIHPAFRDRAPEGMQLLLAKQPYKSYALIAQAFYPQEAGEGYIHPRAIVDAGAEVHSSCVIEAGAVVQTGARIGARTRVESNAVVGRNVEIGEDCEIGACASVSHALLGNRVRIYPGARVGADGFGFAMSPTGHVRVPQLGRVIIEDGVEVGCNSTIDRGAGPDTVIGAGTMIDNLVQIGHNCHIGKHCVLVSQSGVSGSTTLEDFVALAAQAGVAGHVTVGMGARIGVKSGTMRDVPPGVELLGAPPMPAKEFWRFTTWLMKTYEESQKERRARMAGTAETAEEGSE